MHNASLTSCAASADAAFGPGVSSRCRNDFDFTITFEQAILVMLPAAVLLLVAPIRFAQLFKSRRHVKPSHLRNAKMVTATVLAVLQLALVGLWASHGSPSVRVNSISISAACVSFVSSLVLCGLSYTEHVKSPRPSSLLNVFLLLSVLFDCALVRTLWLTDTANSIAGVYTAAFCVKVVLLLLEAIGKKKHLINPPSSYAPEETAGLYARAVLAWVNPLLQAGFKRLLTPGDLFVLDDDMTANQLHERFQFYWKRSSRKTSNHRLIFTCIKTLRSSLISVVFPRLILLAFTICQPLIVSRFLNFLEDLSQSTNIGYGLVAAYGFVYLGISLSQALYWHRNARSVAMLRSVLVTSVFSTLTELNTVAASDAAAVTLMSSDVDVIVRATREIHEFWANIIQIAIGTWLLSNEIGYAAAGPIIASLLALLATIFTSPLAKKYRVGWLKKTQERIAITSAMIGHIKSIKMSGLTKTLSGAIATQRFDEIVASRPFRIVGSITSSIAQIPMFISPVIAFAMFQGVAAQTGLSLGPTRLFAALALITLQAQPLFWMFEMILDLSAASGAFERIQTFMLARESMQVSKDASNGFTTEMEMQPLVRATTASAASDSAITLQNTQFGWTDSKSEVSGVNFSVSGGELVMLIGPVASGKSTLLKGILGEVPFSKGQIHCLEGSRSWCDQSPWISNQSIRDNIIGYSRFDQETYSQVIKACDLEDDLAQLPQGDGTVVGSKGLSLSGGQKQRVALARAAYKKPAVAIFDDIFSGLDQSTAQRVFTNLFSESGLFRQWHTAVVLATQSVNFMPMATILVTLNKDGTQGEVGPFSTLSLSRGYIQTIAKEKHEALEDVEEEETKDSKVQAVAKTNAPTAQPESTDSRRQLGDATVYRYYFGSIGLPFVVTLVSLEVIWAFFQSFPTIWLKFWSDSETKGEDRSGYYLSIYAALQVVGALWFAVLIWVVLVKIAAKSGIRLHQRLLDAVVNAPLSLFSKSDIGSITTRFSQDIGMVDNQLPLALVVTLGSFFAVLAKAGLLAASSYYVAISFPFLGIFYFYLQRGYLRTSRQLRLLDLEEKAPVYSQFLETLDGLATIRAFGWADAAIQKNHELVDKSQKPFYLLIMIQRWLVLVLDLTTTALALLVVGFAVFLRGSASVGLTGAALVQLISMSEVLTILIQFWTSIETSIGAVARIKQFAEDTGEEHLPGEKREPPAVWPQRGHVVISDLSASYGEDTSIRALDGINMEIQPGEKVAICGRTGSGKSSLFLTLLRLLDYSKGSITIDSEPLESMPRETIRSRLIAISQDQFILPGSIRDNIDPFGSHSTESITNALAAVGLWAAIEARGGLDGTMKEDTLSHGQKQLFFMSRAVLRKDVGRVVLLDEATSSVDVQTEEDVKQVIQTQFKQHTVISIAHRLETILDFDRVFVLEKGTVVQVGNPKELLQTRGYFRTLWDASQSQSL